MNHLTTVIYKIDVVIAVEIADNLGMQFLLERAVKTINGCYAVSVSDDAVRGQFLASLTDSDRKVNDTAVRLTVSLYGLFPGATQSEVTGLIEAGVAHPDGQKSIPRENLSPPPHHIAINQFWQSLCSERLAAGSLASVLRLHDQYGKVLLTALRTTYHYLDEPTAAMQRRVLATWALLEILGTTLVEGPRETAALNIVLTNGGIRDSHPRGRPLDQQFHLISGAAFSAGRELAQYLTGDRPNAAIIVDQLARIRKETEVYRVMRLDLDFVDEQDPGWIMQLPAEADQLGAVTELLIRLRRARHHRLKAQQAYGRFMERVALVVELIKQVQQAAAEHTLGDKQRAQVAGLPLLLDDLAPQLEDWTRFAQLKDLVDSLVTLTAAGNQAPEDTSTAFVRMQDVLAELEQTKALNLEVWLMAREVESECEGLCASLCTQLETHGIRATCTVCPFSLDEPLARLVLLVVKLTDARQIDEVQHLIRDSVFTMFPDTVQHIRLMIRHQHGLIMPFAFETWRTSGNFDNPYRRLLGLGMWTPITDIDTVASRHGLTVDRREHPVATSINNLRTQFAQTLFAFGHLTALYSTATDPSWLSNLPMLAQQLNEVSEALQGLREQEGEVLTACEHYRDWLPLALLHIDAVAEYLDVVLSRIRGTPLPNDIVLREQQLREAYASLDNKLYFEHETTGEDDLTVDVVQLHFIEASDGMMRMLADLSDELHTILRPEQRSES